MNLIELAKSSKRNLHIEIRPMDEYIVSFGKDCMLITRDIPGTIRYKTPSIHGRGTSLNDAARNLVSKMSDPLKRYTIRFPADFDTQHNEFQVEGLIHEDNIFK